jgi:hypothetical protein
MLKNADGGRVHSKMTPTNWQDYFDRHLKNITQSEGRLQRDSVLGAIPNLPLLRSRK